MKYEVYVRCTSVERHEVEATSPADALARYGSHGSLEADEPEEYQVLRVVLGGGIEKVVGI